VILKKTLVMLFKGEGIIVVKCSRIFILMKILKKHYEF